MMYSMLLNYITVHMPRGQCKNKPHMMCSMPHIKQFIMPQMAACGQLGNLEVTAAAGRTPAPLLDPPPSLAHVLGAP